MAYLDQFHHAVGQTIMECQRIEHDIKLIYAGMLKGDIHKNLEAVKNEALGPVLSALEELDNCDVNPYFSKSDYKLLYQIKNIRNWLAHTAYMDFLYEPQGRWEAMLDQSYNKLIEFNNRMKKLGNFVEDIRIEILKKYGRI